MLVYIDELIVNVIDNNFNKIRNVKMLQKRGVKQNRYKFSVHIRHLKLSYVIK
jgi:hypothetical protein